MQCSNGTLSLWYMGNAQDIQSKGESFVTLDDFSKFAKEFLMSRVHQSVREFGGFDVEVQP